MITKNLYIRIFKYVLPYKKRFLLSVFLAISLSIMAPLRPFWIQKTIEKYIQKGALSLNNQTSFWENQFIKGIILITAIQIGLILIETVFRFIFSFISAWLGQSIVKDLRLEVFKKITYFKLRQFDKTPIGTLSTRTINDIEAINNIFSDGFIPIIADLLSIVIVLVSMFYVNWRLTFICLAPLPLLLIATYFFKESVKKSFQKVRLVVGQLNAFVQERLSGMNIIQIYNLQKKEFEKFKEINQQHKIANIKGIMAYSVFFPIVEITSAISISFLIYSALYDKVDASILVFYFLCLNQIFRPLRFIADKFNVIQMGIVAAERIFIILDNPDSFYEQEGSDLVKQKVEIQGNIEFKNVSFSYKPDQLILNNLSFEIKKGEKIALVGPTGNGKSSIISLINRLYEFQEGQILIDKIPIQDIDLYCLRRQIGVILQDVFLFSGSIKDNIKLQNNHITDDEMVAASKKLGLHGMIMNLPQQYDFNVMERGSSLSVGQRQLIAFTRMLLYNPKILIMDEATSSIDSESEFLIQKALDTLIADRTAIIVAHRLATIRKADKIFFINNGMIMEQGNHDVLIQKEGYYFELYNKVIKKNKPS